MRGVNTPPGPRRVQLIHTHLLKHTYPTKPTTSTNQPTTSTNQPTNTKTTKTTYQHRPPPSWSPPASCSPWAWTSSLRASPPPSPSTCSRRSSTTPWCVCVLFDFWCIYTYAVCVALSFFCMCMYMSIYVILLPWLRRLCAYTYIHTHVHPPDTLRLVGWLAVAGCCPAQIMHRHKSTPPQLGLLRPPRHRLRRLAAGAEGARETAPGLLGMRERWTG